MDADIYRHLIYLLETEHSLAQMRSIVDYVGSDVERFDSLMKIFLTDEYRIIQRASWPLGNCAEMHPKLIQKHLKKLLKHMRDSKQHPAVKRNLLRIFDRIEIPEKFHGELLNDCITYIADPGEAIAVQAFSLGILQKLTLIYPEIKHEVETIIDSRLPNATPAFTSRAKKYLKATSRLSKSI